MNNEAFGSEENRAAIAAELERVIGKFEADARGKLLARAKADGWSPEQADWIDVVSKAALLQAVASGAPHDEALEAAYRFGRQRLAVRYFESVIEGGKDRAVAFLTVIEVEKDVAVRRGDAPPAYPDEILQEACLVIEQGAAEGLSSDDQIALGFYAINRRLGERQAGESAH